MNNSTTNTQTTQPRVTWQEKLAQANALLEEVLRESPAVYNTACRLETEGFDSPSVVAQFCMTKIGLSEREEFLVLFLDNQNRLIQADVLFQGTINATMAYPREIVKTALKCNAAAIIIAHNHTSGMLLPSEADCSITRRIKEACALVDVRLVDHIIVSGCTNHFSFLKEDYL